LQGIHQPELLYRINGAHAGPKQAEDFIEKIRAQVPDAEILVDLPGNKIRTASLPAPIAVHKGGLFSLASDQVNYPRFAEHLHPGQSVWASDGTLHFTVEEVGSDKIVFRSHSEGLLQNNKGLHVRNIHREIPFLFEQDIGLIETANRQAIHFVGLSFVRNEEDIWCARKLLDRGIQVISKIETQAALENLRAILETVEYILIDRGDLSSEVGLEKIPACQSYIVRMARLYCRKVFLATQILKQMEDKPVPTIAEVVDLYNNFLLGVYGLQLSEETAVGQYPKECLDTIWRMAKEVSYQQERWLSEIALPQPPPAETPWQSDRLSSNSHFTGAPASRRPVEHQH
jgi:pyruvate kinase